MSDPTPLRAQTTPSPRMPLRRRILAATLIVAVIAVLVTAVAAVGLLRVAENSAARESLSQQVDRLAVAKPVAREAIIRGLSQLDSPEYLVAEVAADGTVSGSADVVVPRRIVAQLLAGRDVSTTVPNAGTGYVVEGRALPSGGGVVVAQDPGSVRALSPNLIARIALALAIGLAAAVVAALIATRTLSRPLVALAAAARRLAGGERGVEVEPSRIAEVADVEAALVALDAALVHSEGRQREFLLSISHELRTPLTAIRGYAEALSDGMVTVDQLPEVGRTIEAESVRLTAFTDDLLALARLEADDFSLQLAEAELGGVLSDAASAWRARGASGGVELDVVAGGPVAVRTDAARIRQVIDGLIENALRVSPDGSRVTLTARREAGAAVIEVSDGGPGLTPEDAARAFERGLLRDRYRDVRKVGTGLGLSIASRLIERMGGEISAHSVPGSGALFRIRIPDAVSP